MVVIIFFRLLNHWVFILEETRRETLKLCWHYKFGLMVCACVAKCKFLITQTHSTRRVFTLNWNWKWTQFCALALFWNI